MKYILVMYLCFGLAGWCAGYAWLGHRYYWTGAVAGVGAAFLSFIRAVKSDVSM